jgi:uncharacterized membrane protein
VLLAPHAQQVVLVHFPIARFITAAFFDLVASLTRRLALPEAAYSNFLVAAISTVPAPATGVLAWQFQLAGQKLKGVLLARLRLAGVSSLMIRLLWWLPHRRRKMPDAQADSEYTLSEGTWPSGRIGLN